MSHLMLERRWYVKWAYSLVAFPKALRRYEVTAFHDWLAGTPSARATVTHATLTGRGCRELEAEYDKHASGQPVHRSHRAGAAQELAKGDSGGNQRGEPGQRN